MRNRLILLSFLLIISAKVFGQLHLTYAPSIPNTAVGFFIAIGDSSVGGFMDVKLKGHGLEGTNYSGEISINKAENTFGDPRIDEGMGWASFDFGLTFALAAKGRFRGYGGIGWHGKSYYYQYRDRTGILDENERYFIEDESRRVRKLNFSAGVTYETKSWFMAQLGINAIPFGVDIGVGFHL